MREEALVKGTTVFGGELGHMCDPVSEFARTEGMKSRNATAGELGDLESLCSLTQLKRNILPLFLPKYPGTSWPKWISIRRQSWCGVCLIRGDRLCKRGFQMFRPHALGLFFDEIGENTFDPDA